MRHGIAFRKLSRTSSHRDLMLRNMVSSLLEHESIQTTVAKAKEAARMAERVITWGKSGSLDDVRRAESYLMNPKTTIDKLFKQLSHRYANRPGGYTRIHKFGHRKGDHAETAILELVDSPNDLKFAVTAKAVGRELARAAQNGKKEAAKWVAASEASSSAVKLDELNPVYKLLQDRTLASMKKVLRFRDDALAGNPSMPPKETPIPAFVTFQALARESFYKQSAILRMSHLEEDVDKLEDLRANSKKPDAAPVTVPRFGRAVWAGQEDLAPPREALVDEDAAAVASQADSILKKKLRHSKYTSSLDMQRSALRRAKGHQAAPRTLQERRTREDMPEL